MYHRFYETFPRVSNPAASNKDERGKFLAPFPTQFMCDARSQSQRSAKFTSMNGVFGDTPPG